MHSTIELKCANVSQILEWPYLPDNKSDYKVCNVCLLGAQNWRSNIANSVNIFVINQKTFNGDQATNQDFQKKLQPLFFNSFIWCFNIPWLTNLRHNWNVPPRFFSCTNMVEFLTLCHLPWLSLLLLSQVEKRLSVRKRK